jgi:hypothetical protein
MNSGALISNGNTAFTGATMLFEILYVLAEAKSWCQSA